MKGHPLDQLTPHEVKAAADTVIDFFESKGWGQPRFSNITLKEPERKELLAFEKGGPKPLRTAFVIATEQTKRTPIEVNVDLNSGTVASSKVREGVIVSIVADDVMETIKVFKNDPELIRLVGQYDLTMDQITIDPWPIQATPGEIPTDKKWTAGFMYYQREKESNFYSHPLPFMPIMEDGTGKVVRIDNAHKTLPPLNMETQEYHKDLVTEPFRSDLKPLQVVQPEGPSFTVEGSLVKWQKWEVRVGFNYREGLVLHNIGYSDGGRLRPILHRISTAEMAVPYGDSQFPFNKKLAFDAGDAGLGLLANSLQLGCDCLGVIKYFDGVVSNSKGDPVIIKNAVCLHEEDDGTSWKHTDMHSGHCEVRRGRKLVFSFMCTLANYEYLFRYSLKTDASIEAEVKLTGQISVHTVSPNDGTNPRHGTMILPGVVGPYHQHLFCARIDPAIDDDNGGENVVVSEVDVLVDEEPSNIYGNAFYKVETNFTTEKEAQRNTDATKSRFWKLKNPTKTNAISGLPVSYKLVPSNGPGLLGKPGSVTMARAGFASKQLWVTPYKQDEQWPGGEYPLQNPVPSGVLKWIKQDRPLESPVVWHTFGLTHLTRAEDFPVMPVETTGFHLKPANFFSMNPANDLPPLKDASSVLAFPVGESTCCDGSNGNGNVVQANGNGVHANGNGVHANGNGVHANGHH